jgi:hypothetical protein
MTFRGLLTMGTRLPVVAMLAAAVMIVLPLPV